MNKTKIEYCNYTWNAITGCFHGCPYCLHPDTLILMSDLSVKKIKNVNVGNEIMAFDEFPIKKQRKFKKAIITQKSVSLKNIYEVYFKSGKKIICSKDHRWLSERGWKYTTGAMSGKKRRPYLTLNNKIYFFGTISEYPEETLQYKQGYLSGMIKGDGTIGYYDYSGKRRKTDKIVSFRLTLIDNEAIIRTKDYLKDFNIFVNIFKFSKKMEAIRTNKKNQIDKIIKLIEFKNNMEFLRGFISGIFDSEGSYTGVLRIFNSDKKIIEFTENALKKFNFSYKKTHKQRKNKKVYILSLHGGVSENIRFFQLFNPAIIRKRNKIFNAVHFRKDKQEIISIKKLKKRIKMIDISTTTNTFIANGFLTHNCYARKIAMRFQGHFQPCLHVNRLDEPKKVKKPSVIFADSMSDFWGKGVLQEWRDMVYETMRNCPQHTFLLLTKQPQNIKDIKKIPENVWIGVSITVFDERWRIKELVSKRQSKIFVSLEPLLTDIISDYIYLTDWIIVGALTGFKKELSFRPKKETIEQIIHDCRRLNKPLFIKNNIGWHKKTQEFPDWKNYIYI